MTCYSPLLAKRGNQKNANGKLPISIVGAGEYAQADEEFQLTVPCKQCLGCRYDYTRDWAIRCMHELQMHTERHPDYAPETKSSFITTTYNPSCLPSDGSLSKRHFQLFLKRLRKRGVSVRYFQCGEYGERFSRPHYHAILFGYTPSDLQPYKRVNGQLTFTSEFLSDVWGMGHVVIGSATYESAAYVARYIIKKQNGETKHTHYMDHDTGLIREPEYAVMSRGGTDKGIGYTYYQKYKHEMYKTDSVVLKGKEKPLPKYYDTLYEAEYPDKFRDIKAARISALLEHKDNNTPERMAVRYQMQQLRHRKLKRGYEIHET